MSVAESNSERLAPWRPFTLNKCHSYPLSCLRSFPKRKERNQRGGQEEDTSSPPAPGLPLPSLDPDRGQQDAQKKRVTSRRQHRSKHMGHTNKKPLLLPGLKCITHEQEALRDSFHSVSKKKLFKKVRRSGRCLCVPMERGGKEGVPHRLCHPVASSSEGAVRRPASGAAPFHSLTTWAGRGAEKGPRGCQTGVGAI